MLIDELSACLGLEVDDPTVQAVVERFSLSKTSANGLEMLETSSGDGPGLGLDNEVVVEAYIDGEATPEVFGALPLGLGRDELEAMLGEASLLGRSWDQWDRPTGQLTVDYGPSGRARMLVIRKQE